MTDGDHSLIIIISGSVNAPPSVPDAPAATTLSRYHSASRTQHSSPPPAPPLHYSRMDAQQGSLIGSVPISSLFPVPVQTCTMQRNSNPNWRMLTIVSKKLIRERERPRKHEQDKEKNRGGHAQKHKNRRNDKEE